MDGESSTETFVIIYQSISTDIPKYITFRPKVLSTLKAGCVTFILFNNVVSHKGSIRYIGGKNGFSFGYVNRQLQPIEGILNIYRYIGLYRSSHTKSCITRALPHD
jgi:hypothetical protein